MSVMDYGFGGENPTINRFIQKQFPSMQFNGTELVGGWSEITEVNGAMWHAVNATYNAAIAGFTQINPLQASTALVITATGFLYYTAAAGAPSPIIWAPLETLGYFNVKDFGAVGNGTTDDTVAIQKTLTAATSGGIIFFPPGTYLVSATLVLPASGTLMGSGSGATIMQTASGFAGDLIHMASSNQTVQGIRFDNQGATVRSAGNTIATYDGANNGHDGTVQVCTFVNYNVAVSIEGTNEFFVQNCEFAYGNYAIVSGRLRSSADVFITNCWGQNSSATFATLPFAWVQVGGTVNGVAATSAGSLGGLSMHGCEWNSGGYGLLIDTTNTAAIGSSFVSSTFFDSNHAGASMRATNGGGASTFFPSMWEFSNCWFATSFIGDAIQLVGADSFSFSNCIIANAAKCGVRLTNSTKNTQFVNCTVLFNNGNSAVTSEGAGIFVSSATNTIIKGCNFGINTTWPTLRQSYGVAIDNAGGSAGVLVDGCNFVGGYTVAPFNMTAIISSATAFLNPIKFCNNLGLNPGGTGQSSPATPATSVAVTNPYPFDCMVYIALSGATLTQINITGNGTSATGAVIGSNTQGLTVPAGPVRVLAGERIALAYSGGTPGWAWRLD